MSEEIIHLYAFPVNMPSRDTFVPDMERLALVGSYPTEEEAKASMDVQEMCFSDEGLFFRYTKKVLHTTVTYDDLIETVSK